MAKKTFDKPSKIAKKTAAKAASVKAIGAHTAAHKPSSAESSTRKSSNAATERPALRKPGARHAVAKNAGRAAGSGAPVLLSGGNPQIPKGDGDVPVQAYIAAMPGWKRAVGQRLDALIERAVPGVRKAVKWNSPFYGVEDRCWFLSFHCFTKYIKVTFFRGLSLRPVPPGPSKSQDTRYLDIREDEPFDEAQFIAWVQQASELPGERL